jgi:uncharacterized protein YbjT (DUF2867 family)
MLNKIFIAGGTGCTGRIIVGKLIAEGIHPHLLVRDPAKADRLFGQDVVLHQADVRELETLIKPMHGMDAVISAIGTRTPVGHNCPKRVDYEGVANLVKAAQINGIQRFILISSIAVTHPEHPLNRFGHILEWKRKGEEILQNSGLDYTIVRPGGLTDTLGGRCELVFGQGDHLLGTISREDLAEICLQALKNPSRHRTTFEAIATDQIGQPDWSALFSQLTPDHVERVK